MSLLNYFQKLPTDAARVITSVSSELTGQETEEVSKELKKVQDKGKKGKSIVSRHQNNGLKLANMPQKMEMPACSDYFLQISAFDKAIHYRF